MKPFCQNPQCRFHKFNSYVVYEPVHIYGGFEKREVHRYHIRIESYKPLDISLCGYCYEKIKKDPSLIQDIYVKLTSPS
jgi:hypothetical protein